MVEENSVIALFDWWKKIENFAGEISVRVFKYPKLC